MRRFLLALLCGLALLPSAAMAAGPTVVTTVKPLQLIAAAVLDGIAVPEVLLPPAASPHNYALRPSDRRLLANADRIYWVGPDLERFLQRLLESQPSARRLDQVPGLMLRRFGEEDDHGHGHHDHHAHDHEHDDHDHAPGTLDAHIWLSTDNARALARWMAEDLAELFPGHAATLLANAEALDQRLEQLQQRLEQQLRPLAGRPYFVFHDAYGYLEDSVGLRPRGVFSLSAEIQPGAQHVQRLRATLTDAGSSCIFREPQFPTERIAALTNGLSVRTAELDPLGIAVPVDANGYEALLTQLGENLAACLQDL